MRDVYNGRKGREDYTVVYNTHGTAGKASAVVDAAIKHQSDPYPRESTPM